MKKYFKTLLIALDQFGMALCGGNEDCTVSATTRYFYTNSVSWYWTIMRLIIDTTFYPVDGNEHCIDAYKKDKNEEYKTGYKPVLIIGTILICLIISIFTYSYYLYKLIK